MVLQAIDTVVENRNTVVKVPDMLNILQGAMLNVFAKASPNDYNRI